MRASLNFSLPDDQEEFEAALLGGRAIGALRSLDERMRRILKDGIFPNECLDLVQSLRDMIDPDVLAK